MLKSSIACVCVAFVLAGCGTAQSGSGVMGVRGPGNGPGGGQCDGSGNGPGGGQCDEPGKGPGGGQCDEPGNGPGAGRGGGPGGGQCADECGDSPMGAVLSEPVVGEVSEATRGALLAALEDERKAGAFYLAVLEKHGQVMPFAKIVHAETRHAQLVANLMTARGMEVPANTQVFPAADVPATVAGCCDAAIQAEIDNAVLFDELFTQIDDEGVRVVFEKLQWMSLEKHLPAFRRFATR